MLHFFLLDHIIHHIDLTRFFMGEVEAVSAFRTRGVPDRYAFAATLKFKSGASGSLSCGFRAPSFDNNVVIYGDGPVAVEVTNWSRLEYRAENLPVGKGGYEDSTKVSWDGGISYQDGVMRPGYRTELSLWADGILSGTRCHADVEDAWRDMVVLETLLESLRVEEPREVEYGE
jgi:myo-inositol 2-dehydrogenase/D-chiro-inositol 1-dehydrogenase